MRLLIAVLSVFLLFVIGALGEGLLNFIHGQGFGGEIGGLAPMTELALRNYRLNMSDFIVSLTPFQMLFVGATAQSYLRKSGLERFVCVIIMIWLIALIYISLFVFSLVFCFHIGMEAAHRGSPVKWMALASGGSILILFAAILLRTPGLHLTKR